MHSLWQEICFGILILITVCTKHTDGQQTTTTPNRVDQIGNGMKPSASGLNVPGATFILNDQIKNDGIVFAYSAYIRSQTAIKFQIWRPTVNRTRQFTLMAETAVLPSVINQREDYYIESGIVSRCSLVKQNDKIGVYLAESPGAVAYVFDSSNPSALKYVVKNLTDPTKLGDQLEFDPITFPYDFSVMTYLDTAVGNATVDANGFTDCPKGLLIPEYVKPTDPPTTTTAPITGRPGATGQIGPMGATGQVGPQGQQGVQGFNGSQGVEGVTGPPGIQGATGSQGPRGANGSQGVIGGSGATGPSGGYGATGFTGPQGLIGPPGPRGDLPLNFTMPTPAPQQDPGLWENPDMVFYLYIWLAIVTFFLFIVFIMAVCLCCKYNRLRRDLTTYEKYKKDDEYLHSMYDNPEMVGTNRKKQNNYADVNGKTDKQKDIDRQIAELSSYDPKPEWMSSMKPDQTFDYEVGTLDRPASNRNKRIISAPTNRDSDPVTCNSAPNLLHSGLSTDYYGSSNGVDKDELVNY